MGASEQATVTKQRASEQAAVTKQRASEQAAVTKQRVSEQAAVTKQRASGQSVKAQSAKMVLHRQLSRRGRSQKTVRSGLEVDPAVRVIILSRSKINAKPDQAHSNGVGGGSGQEVVTEKQHREESQAADAVRAGLENGDARTRVGSVDEWLSAKAAATAGGNKGRQLR